VIFNDSRLQFGQGAFGQVGKKTLGLGLWWAVIAESGVCADANEDMAWIDDGCGGRGKEYVNRTR
jgi:hypothetical protein